MTEIVTIGLPVEPKKLANFLQSLLGQTRRTERRFNAPLMFISFSQISSLIDALLQRTSQNESAISNFSATCYFLSGKTVTLNSVQAFQTFVDRGTEYSLGISITLTALVFFPQRDLPERQVVRMEMFSNNSIKDKFNQIKKYGSPELSFAIESTDVTWSEDIYSLISRHMSEFADGDILSRWKHTIKEYGALPFLLLVAVVVLINTFMTMNAEREARLSAIQKVISKIGKDISTESISQKLDALLFNMSPTYQSPSFDWKRISIAGIGLICAYVSLEVIARLSLSHVVALNDNTEKELLKVKERRVAIKWSVLIGFAVGIIASIFAAHIDGFISELFS